jgi:hypothetical protein
MDVYFNTGGRGWESALNWMDGDPCLQRWHGVECDTNGSTVVKLYVLILCFDDLGFGRGEGIL